jgi:serine phosphatase RsbU (regulator of sigma subunit)
MYRNKKRISEIAIYAVAAAAFSGFASLLSAGLPVWGAVVFSGALFVLFSILSRRIARRVGDALRRDAFRASDTRLLSAFADRLRFSFTTNDLISALRETLEFSADATVLLVDMPKRYLVYNSASAVGTDPSVFSELVRHYDGWRDGVFFFDDNLDLVSDQRAARGFFMVKGKLHVYVFLRFLKVMEAEIFPELYVEFAGFLSRNETVEKMFSIAALSKDWSMVAETQRSFLPKTLPDVEGLELAAFFKPLVNVSGDFYDVLPLDEKRTLLLLGDVSGKGLAAALIMGIVMNTIRISEDKEDLESLVRNVDAAIKGMRLEDKYTVLFLGLVDTERMTLRYVNASMADPLVISETRAGRQIRHLKSTCSLIGILDLDVVGVEELQLFPDDVVFIASDGVSEVAGPGGVMLGEHERWIDYVTDESSRPMKAFVEGFESLAADYSGGAQLRDDLTVLAARVAGGLK